MPIAEPKVKLVTGENYSLKLEFLEDITLGKGDVLEIHPTVTGGFNMFIIRKEEPNEPSTNEKT